MPCVCLHWFNILANVLFKVDFSMFYFFLAQITSSDRSLHSFCNIKLKYLPKHCKQRHYIALFRLHKILCTVCRSNTTTDTQT